MSRSDAERRRDIRTGTIVGMIPLVPLLIAAVGWTAGWNAYINLSLTLGGAVLIYVAFACTMDRYQSPASRHNHPDQWISGGHEKFETPVAEVCHICGKRRDEPGELYCSAAHPLKTPNEESEQ